LQLPSPRPSPFFHHQAFADEKARVLSQPCAATDAIEEKMGDVMRRPARRRHAAKALKLERQIGNPQPGKEADFLVLDPVATPLLARRTAKARAPQDLLFALSLLADDRCIERTYIAGRLERVTGGGTTRRRRP
jgi:hypothetical protein